MCTFSSYTHPSPLWRSNRPALLNVFLGNLNYNLLKLFVKSFYFLIIIICCWSIGLHNGDVKRCCPETNGDEPAGNWLAPHDCVHGVLVNKKTNPIFMSVLFATEVKLMSILSSCFARVPPSYLTESKDTPAISSHLMSKFFQLSWWSQCSHVPRSNADIGSSA